VEYAAVELVALLVKRRQRIAMDRDQVPARDDQVHLAQRLGVLGAMPPRAVEDEKDVVDAYEGAARRKIDSPLHVP
jgi:hypothetical protein